jgi:NADH-quinone oxidoreductase subunit K
MADSASYLAVGAALFVLGGIGFVTRRNLILIFLSAELMLHGVSLTLLTFGRVHQNLEGQAFTIFILTVAACEAALGLSLILALYQRSKSLDIDLWSRLREPDLPASAFALEASQPLEQEPPPAPLPRLTPAGRPPQIDDDFPAELAATADARTIITPSPVDDGEYR